MGVNGVLAFFFYRFSFLNPDQGSCWAIVGVQTAKAEESPGYTNVSDQFHFWFMWGFIFNCAGLVYSLCAFIYLINYSEKVHSLANFAAMLTCGGTLTWIIIGAVLRWSFTGKVCSGDFYTTTDKRVLPYQWQAGMFMKVYLVASILIMILAACCGVLYGLALSCGFYGD